MFSGAAVDLSFAGKPFFSFTIICQGEGLRIFDHKVLAPSCLTVLPFSSGFLNLSTIAISGRIVLFIYLLVVQGLHCFLLAFSSCGKGYAPVRCTSFSLPWLLLFRSMGCGCVGFSSCSTLVQELGLSSCGPWA